MPKLHTKTVQYITVQCSVVQFSMVQFRSLQFSIMKFSRVKFSSVQCSAVQFNAVQCTLQCASSRSLGPATERPSDVSNGRPESVRLCRVQSSECIEICIVYSTVQSAE